MSTNFDLKDTVERLNRRRFVELVYAIDNPNSNYNQLMDQIRAEEISKNAFKENSDHRLFAVLTPDQDAEFVRQFGPHYYRDKEFFTKRFPQTLAMKPTDV